MSGAGGYMCFPIPATPLPLFEWHWAQWSAQCARASLMTSGESATGFVRSLAPAGNAMARACRAARRSSAPGCAQALNPSARVFKKTSPLPPTMPANAMAPARNQANFPTVASLPSRLALAPEACMKSPCTGSVHYRFLRRRPSWASFTTAAAVAVGSCLNVSPWLARFPAMTLRPILKRASRSFSTGMAASRA
jgi:hypothetical protein